VRSSPLLLAAALLASAAANWVGVARGQFFPSEFELSSAVHLDEPDSAAQAHLERIKAFVAERQWDEAVETLRQVSENAGSKVIELADRRWVPLADYCHVQLAALPAEALDLYRRRVDPLAKRWYEEGLAERDQGKLSAVVNQFFCSSSGDEALLALGELVLEQGQPLAARAYWQQIIRRPWEKISAKDFERMRDKSNLPPDDQELLGHWYVRDDAVADGLYRLRHDEPLSDQSAERLVNIGHAAGLPPPRLAYPGTDLDLAAVRARLIVASVMAGELERARTELDGFVRLHPDARGALAGKQVNYAAALGELVSVAAKWPSPRTFTDWPTFAGAPDRNAQAPAVPELAEQAWPPIELGDPVKPSINNSRVFSPRRIAENPEEGLLSYHPVVAGELLLVATATQVLAFNLQTGKPAWPSSPGRPPGEIFAEESPAAARNPLSGGLGVPRFTLTVSGGKLFARVGSQVTVRPIESFDHRSGSLVCLDLAAQGRLLWKIKPDDEKWAFEGAPLAEGPVVYVAMRRSDVRPEAHVACFDAQTGRRLWRTMICSAETPGGGNEETTHNLLTLHEGTLYANTNLGAVAAISARQGRLKWIALYQRARRSSSDGQDKRATHFYRDLNPCVYHDGMLLAAPSDSEAILAWEATSGQLLWETTLAEDAIHLLGAGGGNLLASGDRLWWIELTTGKIVRVFPDQPRGSQALLGYGRGLLADGKVLWPTREALYTFEQRTGGASQQTAPLPLVGPRKAGGGNLVLAGGHLVIAAADKLYAFRDQAASAPPVDSPPAEAPPPKE
jgi:outer membrane protein assembly factor BamB